MKTIAIVVPWLEGGGAQAALEGIMERLDGNPIELVILFRGSRNHEGLLGKVSRVTTLDLPRSLLGALRASFLLPAQVRRADAVYSLMRGSHVVIGLMASHRMLKGKLAATIHQLPSSERGSFKGRCEELAMRRALRTASVVTAPSQRAISELRESKLARTASLRFEPNLLTEVTDPLIRPSSSGNGPIKLLFAGRLTEQKGLDGLLESFEGSGLRLVLRVLGDGEERGALEAASARLGASIDVSFEGRVDSIGGHLDWADFAIMPSRRELNPMFVWEAWARGRGVIASDIPPFLDLRSQGPLIAFGSLDAMHEFLRDHVRMDEFRTLAFVAGPESIQRQEAKSSIVQFLTK